MTWRVELGDSREQLRALDDACVDAVVTDPPYELGFMGKKWDASGIAYDVGLWREVLRVLKPGGHLLAFGGTRTYHRMACAIEDAGFEIRDSIHWIYGSGFPKSLDVSKAIDKAAGAERGIGNPGPYVSRRPRAQTKSVNAYGDGVGDYGSALVTAPATDAAKQWQGFGTALKPSHEPVVVARKPLDGTVAANVLAHGTGALNIDGCRVAHATEADFAKHAAGVAAIKARGGSMAGSWANASDLSGANDVSRAGRWPPNAVFSHLPECGDTCAEGCAVAELDGQSGESKSVASGYNFESSKNDNPTRLTHNIKSGVHYGDTGGASRFFPAFRYEAKPSRAERDQGLSGFMVQRAGGMTATVNGSMKTGSGNDRETIRANVHPTVKPVELMRWLVRLVTPPGGVVLDPFTGSGTTGCAAVLERCSFVGVELSDEYRAIACARIKAAEAGRPCEQLDLFGGW